MALAFVLTKYAPAASRPTISSTGMTRMAMVNRVAARSPARLRRLCTHSIWL